MTDRPIVDYVITVMAHVKTNSPETVKEDFCVVGNPGNPREQGEDPKRVDVSSSTVVQVAFPQEPR